MNMFDSVRSLDVATVQGNEVMLDDSPPVQSHVNFHRSRCQWLTGNIFAAPHDRIVRISVRCSFGHIHLPQKYG